MRFLPSECPVPVFSNAIHDMKKMLAPRPGGRLATARRRPLRRVIQLPAEVGSCRHGHKLEETVTEEVGGGWMVWGRYPCSMCGRVGLDYVSTPPDVVLVGDRRLAPRRVVTA